MTELRSIPGGNRFAALRGIAVSILVLLALLAFNVSTYRLDEAKQALVLQFGRPVGEPITDAGIHFRIPFVQEVRYFEKRQLAWDGDPNQIPTLGREFINVDTTARWRIADPRKFFESVRDEAGAQSRLDDILDSTVRDRISNTELTDIIRSASWQVDESDLQAATPDEDVAETLTKTVQVGREKLTRDIFEEAAGKTPELGIELVDFRLKRLNYIDSVQRQVFERMRSERERVAEGFRSEGDGEAARIRGETELELKTILSEAGRRAEVLRGEADAEATKIYAESYSVDPDFYGFLRSLESYRLTLGRGATLFLGPESEYLRVLREPSKR